ncbi:phosphatidylinositol 4-kinase alpha 1 isoform X2 [Argentina anserina]|uniref:phosphatidylinositol 4-kinase alpha 1 isoform X2 n=1 Tax=Argentina anserina TaxID=57926 RepID=UPI0021768226|nr:phosphatidylinositol 4-kinase alpha 1 isoform X2 [Potentilla anserina]
MESLMELCDLIADHPAQFAEKLSWICGRCPPPESLLGGSPRVTRSQLNAVLAVARFLSKCSDASDLRPKSAVLEFLRSVPASFDRSFWPQSFGTDLIGFFFVDFLGYVSKAAELSPDFASDVAGFSGEVVVAAISDGGEDLAVSRAFLTALSQNFPPILPHDAEKLINMLIDQSAVVSGNVAQSPVTPRGRNAAISETSSSAQSSPMNNGNHHQGNESNEVSNVSGSSGSGSSKGSMVMNGSSIMWKSGVDQLGVTFGLNDGGSGGGAAMLRQQVAQFEEESVENLEKQEVAFKLIAHILEKARVDTALLEEVRLISKRQLQSMYVFLRIRKRDWSEHGALLKARINTKLSVYRAAVELTLNCLACYDTDGKSAKKLAHETVALLMEAAEACLQSVWRKVRICEELFGCLLSGLAQIAVKRGGQALRILLIRLKPVVLAVCTQAETWASSQGAMFDSVLKTSCEIIESCWTKERAPVDTFIMGLATSIRERNDYEEQGCKDKEAMPVVQLNVVRLLADLNVAVNKSEVVDMILPLFIESLEEGDATTPSLLRLRLLDAVSRMASLGFEKSYRETVVLMTRSYLNKLSSLGSADNKTVPQEATTERVETLPAGFLLIASGLTNTKLRSDYRHRLLSLCSDVGLAAESKSGRSGADFLGPLLPAVAEICSDFDPTVDVEPSLLKLFRNLWFYIALFGLAPPIQKVQQPLKQVSTTLNSVGSIGTIPLQAVGGPYMWNSQWSTAVQRIAQGTPPLVVSSVKWLEDELELNALHNPGSRRGNGNEKAALTQRAALSTALGGRVDVAAMTTISGVKATYLLAVAFLEIIRFSSNGGILNGDSSLTASRSAFSCVFEYLKTPNLMPAVFQCLMATVHRAFETAVIWLEDRISETGNEAEVRESTLFAHACFLIKSMSQREEHIREVSVNLLTQLRDKFPQVLWNSSCVDSLLFSIHNDTPAIVVNDPAWVVTVRSLYQKIVREWIIKSLSYAPCSSQGLLQEKLCKANTWQRAQHTPDVVSLLSEIRIGTGKTDCWNGIQTANIPAVMAAAAAASGGNLKLTEAFNLEVLSTGIVSATMKCNHAGEIAGMRRLYNSMGGFQSGTSPTGFGLGVGLQRLISGAFPQQTEAEDEQFNGMLLTKFVRLLQQFVSAAEKGWEVDKSQFRETCSQATALLLSNLGSTSKSYVEGFSQLLRLLCWCPAYISTSDAMETGVFIWTWLVSSAPELGSLVLAELVDAWLWTIDTKRGIFASDVKYSGPAAKLRPQLSPGEPEVPPEVNPVEQIMAHRLWLGFFIDRFEVVRHNSIEQLLLLGRMLQGTTKLPWNFSHHPAATGTFFTVMLLGLKFCSCQSQRNLQNFKTGLQLLEDRIYRASLGWFAFEPEWFDTSYMNFTQSEAQSVTAFVHYLSNERADAAVQSDLKGRGHENGNSLVDASDQYHPVWGQMENYAAGREKRKQLLLMLCQYEADRLEVWAQPTNTKETSTSKQKISSEKWIENARTAFSVDPRIALSLAKRFPTNTFLKAEVTQLVQSHILDIRSIPEALPYFVTPKAVDENSALLQQLPHWAACSITQALEFLTPAYKGHPRVMAYVLRVLESYPPERVTFFMPQLVQALRYDEEKLVEGYLLRATQRSDLFAHILIWHLQGETEVPESGQETVSVKVVPNTRSRSQMGETTDGGLYEIFQQDYGTVGSPSFEAARENFIISSAGYAVASLLLQPKDRHNGNLLFDNVGRLVHIDFGFILETSPGGNMRFESAHFKLSHEMTQLLDPSGVMKSDTWNQFVSLCVKGYLAARRHMDGIISTVALMLDSGLPCFSRGDPIGNLRKRFHPEMSEREAANFMIRVCTDAYNKWTTAGYDLIQYLQQGIEK